MARAQLIDEPNKQQELTENEVEQELETQDSFEQPQEPEQLQEEPQAIEEDIPEKYRGKSAKELIEMHQNAEKHIGKQSSEVGELRKLVDEYIQGQLVAQQQKAPQQQEEDDDVDFFVDPKTAVTKAIENHPKIKQAEEFTQQYKKQAALAQLQANHPDMQDILQDNKFAEWVKASKWRTQMFIQADQSYDYDAANELFNDWKERNKTVQQAAQVEKAARKQAVKSANTGNVRGSAEPQRRKIYRRADIIKLMKTDPQRYQALQPEIMQAYQEGRVK